MLATPGRLPQGPDWLYEVRWDGMRLLADVSEGRVRLIGVDGREVTGLLPELDELRAVAPDVLLDGEAVVLADGVPSPRALAERLRGNPQWPVMYLVTDVLRLYGVSLLERPLGERRDTLERLNFARVRRAQLSPVYADGPALLAAVAAQGMAGVIAKRRHGQYQPGVRSPDWVVVSARPAPVPHRR